MRKIKILIFTLLVASTSFAQGEFGTHFMSGTWQATMTNPAMLPSHKVVVSLPSFYGNIGISNLTYNEIFNNSGTIDFENAISKLGDNNFFDTNIAFQTFGIGIRVKRFFFSLNHEIRSNSSVVYPKELAQLVWQGNAQFIGEEISFAPRFQFTNWQQVGFGVGYEINDMITIGARIKSISGIVDLSTSDDSYLKLTTSDDIYQLALDAKYSLQSSGALDYTNFSNYNVNLTGLDFDSFGQLFKSNPGVSFDLGVSVSLGKLALSASALDLGSINWKSNAKQFTVEGTFEFEGITFAENIFEDSLALFSVVDTLESAFTVTETSASYRSALPKQFYLSGRYALTQNLKVGALVYIQRYNQLTRPAFTLSANYNLASVLQLGAAYTLRKGSVNNLGLNAVLKLGPIQLLAATDNIFTVFNPKGNNHANIRLGFNLVFGKVEAAKGSDSPVNFY